MKKLCAKALKKLNEQTNAVQQRLKQNNLHQNDTEYFEFSAVGKPGEVNRQPDFMQLPIYQLVPGFRPKQS